MLLDCSHTAAVDQLSQPLQVGHRHQLSLGRWLLACKHGIKKATELPKEKANSRHVTVGQRMIHTFMVQTDRQTDRLPVKRRSEFLIGLDEAVKNMHH